VASELLLVTILLVVFNSQSVLAKSFPKRVSLVFCFWHMLNGNPDARRVLRHPFFYKIVLYKHDLAKPQNPTRGLSMLCSEE